MCVCWNKLPDVVIDGLACTVRPVRPNFRFTSECFVRRHPIWPPHNRLQINTFECACVCVCVTATICVIRNHAVTAKRVSCLPKCSGSWNGVGHDYDDDDDEAHAKQQHTECQSHTLRGCGSNAHNTQKNTMHIYSSSSASGIYRSLIRWHEIGL